jgi:TP901 family phage tail tape measure protein
MSTPAVVGAARVVFGADTSDFDSAARGVEGVLGRLVEKFQAVETRLKRLGTGATIGITLPFAAMVRAVDKTAGSFEGQMKRVEAALDNVTGDQLKQLSDQARDLGPRVGKGATEAAEGIEELGLAGVSAADILGGGLKATLDLAAAGMADVAPAAGLVTDVMGQFKKTAADLPAVVQNVVGAMDASKFGFNDFAGAVAQGGGVAASAGISFNDFATAVAATSTQFSSGSDAGTSFKTYIQSLVGNSDEAKFAMKKLGIEFFDAQGRMKPLGEQAEILRKALGNLTDESKTDALKTIFGSDAARTAIGLMEQGRVGFEKLATTVAGGDVEAKIAKRLEGSEAASKRIANAWESLKIAFGIEGGLITPLTALKNGYASLLESISHASPAMLKLGTVFSGLAAAMGPLLLILGNVAALVLARFVSGFGLVGRALALLISPVSTIVTMLGEAGLMRVIGMLASRVVAFLGPVGLAVAAFLLFKDTILNVLGQVWAKMTTTLGPPLEAIIEKVKGIFASLAGGPVGSAVSFVVTALGTLADVIGTVMGGVLLIFGELLVRVLKAGMELFSGFLDAAQALVDGFSALVTGDFSGAWDALLRVVTSVCDAIVNAVIALVPDMEVPLRAVYEAAKAWLGDGFAAIGSWLASAVQGMVDYVAAAFPNVVTAAKGVYDGVKGWLVDKFGGLLTWIGNAAKWIGDKYAALKKNLGFGDSAETKDAPPPPAGPKAPPVAPGPKRSVSFDKPEKPKKDRKGRDTSHDDENREQLRDQIELEAARLRGDREAEQAIQDRLDLSKQIEAYQRTGLTIDKARAAAQRDMKDLAAARAVSVAKEIADEREGVALDIAHLDENTKLEDSLSRQAELKRRIAFYYAQTRDLAEATRLAEADQKSVDEARTRVRQRWLQDDADDRAVELAQLRGDTEEQIRQARRVIDIRKRAREIAANADVTDGEAEAQAAAEWDEADRARVTGEFRSTFRDGVRAALDGDLSGFVKNWWKDRVAKGLEEALNSLSDLIASLFAKAGSNGRSSSDESGIGGVLGEIFSGLFKKGGSPEVASPFAGDGDVSKLPAFATGGSFKIGGSAGIDRNLVMFRGTVGEHVNVTKGNDAGPTGTVTIIPSPYFSVVVGDIAAQRAAPIAAGTTAAGLEAVGKGQARNARQTVS